MANPAENYEYHEILNEITSLHAERLRLTESMAADNAAIAEVMKRIKHFTRLAEKLAVERGIERTCADMGIEEPKSQILPALAVLFVSALAAVAIFWSLAFRPAGAVEAPTAMPPAVRAISAVPEAETSAAPAPRNLSSTDGKPTADQIQTVREICAVSYNELYAERMSEWNIGRDDFAKTCEADLLGIAWAESRFDCSVVGDDGHSLGCFQVHDGYHDVSDANRRDFAFSAAWTLDRLVKHGYPRFRSYGIQCHNSCGAGNGYAASVKAWATTYLSN